MSGNDAREGREPGRNAASGDDFSARLRRLEAEIDRERPAASRRDSGSRSSSSGPSPMARAFRMSTEFVAGVIAGGGLGWLIDRGLGTSPWGMIVFLMLGFGAGIYNVMRASGLMAGPPGRQGPKA